MRGGSGAAVRVRSSIWALGFGVENWVANLTQMGGDLSGWATDVLCQLQTWSCKPQRDNLSIWDAIAEATAGNVYNLGVL